MNINQLTDTLNKLSIISPNSKIVIRAKTWRPSGLEESEIRSEDFSKIISIKIKYNTTKGKSNEVIIEVE